MTGQAWFGVTVAVEIAWGADLTADPDTWVWTEITGDVRQDPGVSWSMGRSDEASTSQPATCMFQVNNQDGDYSLGPESGNYPYVRRGTPIRFRVDPDGDGFAVAFQGEAVGFTPNWDASGRVTWVTVSAAGALRRLGQGDSPAQSALRRGLAMAEGVVQYWPCEDGEASRWFESAVAGAQPMHFEGSPDFASNTTFLGSAALPVLQGSYWAGHCPTTNGTGELQVRALVEFPQGDTSEDRGVILSLFTTGTAYRWDLEYIPGTNGMVNVATYDTVGSLITETGSRQFDVNVDPRARRYSLELTQNGSDVDASVSTIDFDGNITGYTWTVTSRTVGAALRLDVNGRGQSNAAGALNQVAVGHVTIQSSVTSAADALDEMTGWGDEFVDSRLARLADENGETLTVTGATLGQMGPQPQGTFLSLLRECEAVDRGVLFDGQDAGLAYRCREEFENDAATLTLDASAGEVGAGFKPVDDDQRTVNKATVTRTRGTTATVEDTDGLMGTDVIGEYETSETVNVAGDARAGDYAGWLVHQGTQPGYRHPEVNVDLRRHPTLARDVLGLQPGSRVDLTNLDSVLTGLGSETVSVFVEGFSQSLGTAAWVASLKCSPYDTWRVGQLGTGVASPISFYAAGTAAAASSGSLTPNLPAGYQVGDLILIFASTRNSGTGTVNTPSGYTALVTSGNVSVLGKIAGSSETDPTITFSNGAANETTIAQVAVFRGTHYDIDQVLLASAVQLNASAANIAYPALTVSEDNCAVVIAGWKQDDWTSVAALSGLAEIEEKFSTLGSDAGQVWDYVIQSTHANISASSFTVTGGTSQISRGLTFALRPHPDPNPITARLDTAGSTLTSDIAQGATSMSVTTTACRRVVGYVGDGGVTAASSGSLSPALPPGWTPGEMFFLLASTRNSGTGTVATPTGWTSIVSSGNVSLFARVAVAGDTAPSVTFTNGAANETTMAQIVAFGGLHPDTSAVVANSATQLNGSAQNIARPALTVASDNCLILVAWWKQDDSTSVANDISAMDGPANGSSTLGNDASQGMDFLIQTTAANLSSGTLTVTGGASAISRCLMVALSPGVGPVWTTDSTDYPMDLDVGGVKVTATACSDVSSPQTMTITAAPMARSAGAAVQLWRPPVLSL